MAVREWLVRFRAMDRRRWRWILFGMIALSLVYVAARMAPLVPHDTEVRVALQRFQLGSRRARGISVSLTREGAEVQHVSARFAGEKTPSVFTTHISLPRGPYNVSVEVEMEGRVAVRTATVEIMPDAVLNVPMPLE